MSRRLVVTADDVGRSRADSEVVLDLFAEGAVSAVTIMPVTPFAEAAADAVAGRPGVRVHVTLTSDDDVPPWRPLTAAPSLVTADGFLHTDPVAASRGSTADVLAEVAAQLGWVRDRVGAVAAVDAHTSVLYGLHGATWLEATLAFCGEEGLGFRLPRDGAPYLLPHEAAPFAGAHARAVVAADRHGVPIPAAVLTNRTSAAEHGSYARLLDSYLDTLAKLPEGTSELFCHPGVPGDDDAATLRGWEARMLRDPRFTDRLAEEGIAVVDHW
ncbi:ChbG/HpnK family deacetylase [Georgenia sp. H159]|uniref:ChbG/HpnK family deacetylase n=1 Tax=Georgenia sp. H159 TaxID=3076115 RepID=UPI002D79017F|nr:ChbG/HpnK family deacetylase [Georgenia sp. H159]